MCVYQKGKKGDSEVQFCIYIQYNVARFLSKYLGMNYVTKYSSYSNIYAFVETKFLFNVQQLNTIRKH